MGSDPGPVICLMGPTAVGKTDLAVALVERLPLEIVSVDSAMVYRGLNIGTAKPTAEVLARAPHRLIDICDPADPYSAARFRADALREIEDIRARGRAPLLVGGTGLYFRALAWGLSDLPAADRAVRGRLAVEAQVFGWDHLHRRLATVDPRAAARIHPNDPQRIQRALEVWELTGRPISTLQTEPGEALPYRLVKLVRACGDRDRLRERIARRFHGMLAAGFEAEVQGLLDRGDLAPDLPSLRSVGYRQMVAHLLGEYDQTTMVARAITATAQYAKRQMTWLRAERGASWLPQGDPAALDAALKIVGSVAT